MADPAIPELMPADDPVFPLKEFVILHDATISPAWNIFAVLYFPILPEVR
jgi:hypothetical protein